MSVRRRFKGLCTEQVDDLPEVCACCQLWESRSATAPICGEDRCDKDAFKGWVEYVCAQWGECGLMAYQEGEMIGYVKYAPGAFFPRAALMPSGGPSPDAVLISCMYILDEARHLGLGKVLLQAALRDLVQRQERAVESYARGRRAEHDRHRYPLMTEDFLLAQGFQVVRHHPVYPLMRLDLKTLASWTENLEAALESLRIPQIGNRAPATYIRMDG